MAQCNDNKIQQYILNKMSEQEEAEFMLHLASCPECQKKIEEIRKLRDILSVKKTNRSVIKLPFFSKTINTTTTFKKYFSIAAIFLMLLLTGIVIYIITKDNKERASEYLAQVEKDTDKNFFNKENNNIHTNDVPTNDLQPDHNPGQSSLDSTTSKIENKSTKKQVTKEGTDYKISIKKAPNVARILIINDGNLVSEENRKELLSNENRPFGTMITPSIADTNYVLNADSTFTFKWNTYPETQFFIYIKADGKNLENFYDNGDTFILKTGKYKNNSYLNWEVKIIGPDSVIRNKGIINIIKQ